MYHDFHKNIKQHNFFSIDNNKKLFLSSKSHIKMISEGWWDTEDWVMKIQLYVTGIINSIQLYCFTLYFGFKRMQPYAPKRRFSKNIFQTSNFFNSSLISLRYKSPAWNWKFKRFYPPSVVHQLCELWLPRCLVDMSVCSEMKLELECSSSHWPCQ